MKFSSYLAVLFFVAVIYNAAGEKKIPSKFIGKFELEKSENFDEYLIAKGFGWFMRKMISLASVTKIFEESKTSGKYVMKNLTSKKNTEYDNIVLGEEFEAEGLDSTQHKITFDYNPDKDIITEKHIRLEEPNDKGETYEYKIDGDYLVMKMEYNGVTTNRYYKRN
ncbi:Cytosolic fatty-acid binding domain and Calycin-like domain and Calycin domain-containing protein [Strongyloides ratti]|uniref:Cytosolic fatty-acid binding domain and Calycin-like domain and Calycin domain-containing protein n=1 Tax=Strongyloides ratti TaxID=34506 RepID=A0A090LGG0_STRRB|nr:Cytosolic fatty-acid binding domain and Calycin-like domain and Calycin domain-containing protein [Strongyloides ratti]CEF68862.1 Cytosolic fatty-acid binding domain and Calycin-like domain and Calycin domain-containing protein [Strongyloides ratti]